MYNIVFIIPKKFPLHKHIFFSMLHWRRILMTFPKHDICWLKVLQSVETSHKFLPTLIQSEIWTAKQIGWPPQSIALKDKNYFVECTFFQDGCYFILLFEDRSTSRVKQLDILKKSIIPWRTDSLEKFDRFYKMSRNTLWLKHNPLFGQLDDKNIRKLDNACFERIRELNRFSRSEG